MQEKNSLINFNESFSYGWETTKKKWPLLLGISFLILSVSFFFEILDYVWIRNSVFMSKGEIFLYSAFLVLHFLLSSTFQYNSLKICLDILNKKKTSLLSFFNLPEMNTLRFLFGSFLYGMLVFLGFLVFIIPGLYLSLRYAFVPTLIIDKKMSIIKAFRESSSMTHGIKWELFAYFLVLFFACFLIILLGILTFFIGIIPALFFVVWIFTFANLYIYKKLL